MRVVKLILGLAAATFLVWAQDAPKPPKSRPPASVGKDTVVRTIDVGKLIEPPSKHVVAVVDGESITAKEFSDFLRSMSPAIQQNFKRNPQAFLNQFAMLIHFEKLAEKTGLDQQYPHKQRLEYQRRTYLFEAQLDNFNSKVDVTDDEKKQYFEEHKDNYRKGYFKMIFVAFHAAAGGTGGLDENKAKETADKVVKEARAGADFVALVKQYSEDAETKSKDGDFGPFTATDPSVPEPLRAAIFKLQPGETSDPLRHANGFYIFRAEKFEQPDFESLRDQLGEPIRRQKMNEWVRSQQNDIQLDIKDKGFFAPEGPPTTK